VNELDNYPTERGFSDLFSVDRSTLVTASAVLGLMPDTWATTGGQREMNNRQIRRSITMQERLEAWRGVCALPAPIRRQ